MIKPVASSFRSRTALLLVLCLLLVPFAGLAASKTPKPTATPQPTVRPTAPTLPATNEKGFLDEGEYVHEDEENGVWIYISPTLRVEILRVADPNLPLVWYEANIYSDVEAGEVFKAVPADPEKWGKAKDVVAAKIASDNKVVFGMNNDYYTYRIARKIMVGIVLRDGQIISEKTVKYPRQRFPTLDTLALMPDGSMNVYYSDELTAQEYLDLGVKDVFSFGPILIRDGELNQDVITYNFGQTNQPRCAVGMVEPGHYYAVLMEGRLNKVSNGETIPFLMDLMQKGGCQTAFNLDGGQTAVMVFMGKQITRIGSYNGGKTSPRTTTDIIGIGYSELVPEWTGK